MKTKIMEILYRAHGAWCALAALLLILGATCSASAQASPHWTTNDEFQCWRAFDRGFCYTNSSGQQWYLMTNGAKVGPGLWQQANLINQAEDQYNFVATYYQNPNLQQPANKVDALCRGFTNNFPHSWLQGNTSANDDLLWATVAFVRAYEITGNQEWLNEAINAFNVVWNRAQVNGNAALYGLGQVQNNGVPTNPDGAVNFNAVIAGYGIYSCIGDSFYTDAANECYTWAVINGNLYNSTTGKVRDSVSGSLDYTCNYGIAIWAAVCENDYQTSTNIAQYLATSFQNSFHPYVGTWTDGGNTYNLLPDYYDDSGKYFGGLTNNNAGYNSICYRGLGNALSAGFLTSWQTTWFEENVEAAFYHRNKASLMWGDLMDYTPQSQSPLLYSWDCSSALTGILNLPQPIP